MYTHRQNKKYYNMTEAELLRVLPDVDINRFAKRGAPNAIMEQAYRQTLAEAWSHSCDWISDFEAAIRAETETR